MAEYEVRVAPHPVCDFCSSAEPRYLEDCETFEVVGLNDAGGMAYIGKSDNDWAACEVCHQLVQGKKWRQLERRAVDAIQRKYPTMPRNRVQHGVQLIHGAFRTHKRVEDLNP